MRFVDEVTIHVLGGAGGNGCVAFRREKHVPRGGPAGGDGGDGGAVILVADPQLSTLLDLRYNPHYRARRGVHGGGSGRHGRCGEDLLVRVPCGTRVLDPETGEELADLVDPGARFVAAGGGRGGRGNLRFATSTNRAPRRADPGEPGEQRSLRLELKLLAEVGIVGLPNAGKSTLIKAVSAARPRVAEYPFTTLVPTLGVVRLDEDRSFVMADIPGLVEGAHRGAGLGHRFLRHIERTRVLLYLLDDRHAEEGTPGDPAADLALLRAELRAHDPALADRPALVAINKADAIPSDRLATVRRDLDRAGVPGVRAVSAVTGAGLGELLDALFGLLHPPAAETPENPL